MVRRERIWRAQAAVIILLLLALLPLPYGYYILLRITCCAVFVYVGIQALDDSPNFAYVLFGVAVVYNPIIRVHLNREIWSIVNVITIIIAVVSMFLIRGGAINAGRTEDTPLNSNHNKISVSSISPEEAWRRTNISCATNMDMSTSKNDFIESFCWLVIAGLPYFTLKATRDDITKYSGVLSTFYSDLNKKDNNDIIFRMSVICAIFINENSNYYPAYEKYVLRKHSEEYVPSSGMSEFQSPGKCSFKEYEALQKCGTVLSSFLRACTNAHKVFNKIDKIYENRNLYFPYDEIEEYLTTLDSIESADEIKSDFVNFVFHQATIFSSENNQSHLSISPFKFVFKRTYKNMSKSDLEQRLQVSGQTKTATTSPETSSPKDAPVVSSLIQVASSKESVGFWWRS